MIYFGLVVVLLGGGTAAMLGYRMVLGSNVDVPEDTSTSIFIQDSTTYNELLERLQPLLIDWQTFDEWANIQGLGDKIKPGHYIIKDGMSNRTLVNKFRAGLQDPMRVSFHNVEDIGNVAGKIARNLQVDSLELYHSLIDANYLNEVGYTLEELRGVFIPNTYEMYWTTTSEDIRNRLWKEYHAFWNADRKHLAEVKGLSIKEVAILASIVQKESSKRDEMRRVAGLYINRLKNGWKLQSDPTVIYAYKSVHPEIGEIRRVLFKMLETDSPYNTYMYEGLPPAPIVIPEVQVIEAVLQAEDHGYFYMCADPERPGYHSFGANEKEHAKNRKKYIDWLNSQRIYR